MAESAIKTNFFGIDANNVLINNITSSWTATEDCILIVKYCILNIVLN